MPAVGNSFHRKQDVRIIDCAAPERSLVALKAVLRCAQIHSRGCPWAMQCSATFF